MQPAGLMEADDLGTYVVKYTGAGQGRKTLVAEVLCAGLATGLGLPVPELVLIEVDPLLGRSEPDEEVQDLLTASPGLNLGMDFLPGALGFDPLAHAVDPDLGARVLWFDAFVGNVDRSWRNPNLLMWHRELWLIDHGATLVFHHSWDQAKASIAKAYDVTGHVLSATAGAQARSEADADLSQRVTEALMETVLSDVPEQWLTDEPGFASPDELRAAYVQQLLARLAARERWRP